ncbi:putative sterigmatocystin biosynthesis P450 monooxygenase [Trichoderma lentiforme]|uniref:Sterigmatocystin biosynthesis P450 monooxygenase n=1 Tax=Trichoderma lentiforme TaxID=1567552 RepID=A0A9P4XMI3_9HYPO|nr:putative sterigmatocystin biosynthesis P450 monooxygenase [Trichoderma lentiforme]
MAVISFQSLPVATQIVALASMIAISLCSYSLFCVIYNLFFHPLRRFPGPLLAKVSGAWARVQNFYGRKAHKIHEAHIHYGIRLSFLQALEILKCPVVRIGPNMLSFSDPSALRDIYMSKAFVKEGGFYNVILEASLTSRKRAKRIYHEEHLLSFTYYFTPNPDPEAHSQRRKLLSRGFSQTAMRDFEPKVASKIYTVLDQWAKIASTSGSAVDIFRWTHMLGFDTVYHLMFDVDPGTVKTGVESEVMQYMRAWKLIYIYKEFVPLLENWGIYVPGYIGSYFRKVHAWKKAWNPNLRLFGGSGTTANTFVYLVWATAQQPDIIRRLQEELDRLFPDTSTISDYLTCNKLPYLNAVIYETMRLYPSTIAILPRTAIENTTVANIPIPKGTIVGTQNYTTHRCEDVFPQANKFIPERWLVDDLTPLKEAFTPFSLGPRKCIGLNLAEMELRILTASFFRRFNVSLDSSMKMEDMVQYDTFNAAPVGAKLLVHLVERK